MELNTQTEATLVQLYTMFGLPKLMKPTEFVIARVELGGDMDGDFRHDEALAKMNMAGINAMEGNVFIVTECGDCPAIVAQIKETREFGWEGCGDSQYVAWMTTL
jgi:hypothetical protein